MKKGRGAASAHSIPSLNTDANNAAKEISPRTQAKQDAYAGVSRWGLLNDAPALNPNRQLLSGFLQAVRRQIREDVARGLVSAVADGEEVDVVVAGGGLRGYYMVGCYVVLEELRRLNALRVARFAGASAGAWCCLFMAVGMHPLDWVETYYETKLDEGDGGVAKDSDSLLDAYWRLKDKMMLRTLPEDAYKRCNGRISISITVLRYGRPHNLIVSEFTSNEDLVAACIASSNIPFAATKGLGKRWRGMVVFDGGATNNVPVFKDRRRRQLVIELPKVLYPFALMLSPSDPSIESLVIRGAFEMRAFLCELSKTPPKAIWWIPRNGDHVIMREGPRWPAQRFLPPQKVLLRWAKKWALLGFLLWVFKPRVFLRLRVLFRFGKLFDLRLGRAAD